MDEHVAHLKKTKVGVAVGTPARIGKLLSETGLTLSTIHNRINLANAYRANKDALSLQALTHIILDVTFIDTKQRSMMDLKEVRDELFKTVLGDKGVRERLRNSKIELVLF
jgi:protein CMS1